MGEKQTSNDAHLTSLLSQKQTLEASLTVWIRPLRLVTNPTYGKDTVHRLPIGAAPRLQKPQQEDRTHYLAEHATVLLMADSDAATVLDVSIQFNKVDTFFEPALGSTARHPCATIPSIGVWIPSGRRKTH